MRGFWELTPIQAELIAQNDEGPGVASDLVYDGTLAFINDNDMALMIAMRQGASLDIDQLITMGGWHADEKFMDWYTQDMGKEW